MGLAVASRLRRGPHEPVRPTDEGPNREEAIDGQTGQRGIGKGEVTRGGNKENEDRTNLPPFRRVVAPTGGAHPSFLRVVSALYNGHINWSATAPKGNTTAGHPIGRAGVTSKRARTLRFRLPASVISSASATVVLPRSLTLCAGGGGAALTGCAWW